MTAKSNCVAISADYPQISEDYQRLVDKKTKPFMLNDLDCGGRNRTRTCDPIDVNDVLYQLSHATMLRSVSCDNNDIIAWCGRTVTGEISLFDRELC